MFKCLALIAHQVSEFGMNSKAGDSSPPQVGTFSVSKTLTLSEEHPFVCQKWMLLPIDRFFYGKIFQIETKTTQLYMKLYDFRKARGILCRIFRSLYLWKIRGRHIFQMNPQITLKWSPNLSFSLVGNAEWCVAVWNYSTSPHLFPHWTMMLSTILFRHTALLVAMNMGISRALHYFHISFWPKSRILSVLITLQYFNDRQFLDKSKSSSRDPFFYYHWD